MPFGSLGYYGVFTANMHTDFTYTWQTQARLAVKPIIAAAQARNIPVISADKCLNGLMEEMVPILTIWFGTTNNTLSFDISVFFGAI